MTHWYGWIKEYFNYSLMLRFSRFYSRYIYNICSIWNGTKSNPKSFYRKLIAAILQFEYLISKTEINFLDTTVFKAGNQLPTKIFTTPTNKRSYLHSKFSTKLKLCSTPAHQQSHYHSRNETLNKKQTENEEKTPIFDYNFLKKTSLI